MRTEVVDRFLYGIPRFLGWLVVWLALAAGSIAGGTWLLLKIGG